MHVKIKEYFLRDGGIARSSSSGARCWLQVWGGNTTSGW